MNLWTALSIIVIDVSVLVYLLIALFTVLLGHKPTIKRNENGALSFTVFLPTYNEEVNIVKKLDALMSQTAFARFTGEVCIYDCSTDRTRELIKEYAQRNPAIRLIEQSSRTGVASTFNQALEVTSDVLVKTDCDSMPQSKDDLTSLLQILLADDKIGAVTGTCVNLGKEGAFRRFLTKLQMAETNLDSTIIAHSTSFVAIRRTALVPVDPDSIAEDTEEFIEIRKRGLRTILEPDVKSIEQVPSKPFARLGQKQRRAHGVVRVLLQNLHLLFNSKYGEYGLVVFPTDFFLLVISPPLLLLDMVCMLYLGFIGGMLFASGVVICILLLFLCYAVSKPRWLSGLLDTQVFALVGLLNFLFGRGTAVWKVDRA